MASLIDLFNPSFLMFLGILVLVVALLVVYFESKMREQNHKILSMVGLVSALAEEMNVVRASVSVINAHSNVANTSLNKNIIFGGEKDDSNLDFQIKNSLITVSDDDNDDNDDESSQESVSENEKDSNDEDDDGDDDEDEDEDDDDDEHDDEDGDADDEDDEQHEEHYVKYEITDLQNKYENEETLVLHDLNETGEKEESDIKILRIDLNTTDLNLELNHMNLQDDNSFSELKSINISLDESKHSNDYNEHAENADYKKMPISKLKNIVVTKGLINDASKLKKNDILKLLGVE